MTLFYLNILKFLQSFIFDNFVNFCLVIADFPEDLQDFVQRLAHRQMQTTQNLQSALLPQLNLPRMRPGLESESDRGDFPMLFPKFPFQSNSDGEGRAYASSSVTMKRPHTGFDVNAHASAFSSVKDVNNEEHMGDILGKFFLSGHSCIVEYCYVFIILDYVSSYMQF